MLARKSSAMYFIYFDVWRLREYIKLSLFNTDNGVKWRNILKLLVLLLLRMYIIDYRAQIQNIIPATTSPATKICYVTNFILPCTRKEFRGYCSI